MTTQLCLSLFGTGAQTPDLVIDDDITDGLLETQRIAIPGVNGEGMVVDGDNICFASNPGAAIDIRCVAAADGTVVWNQSFSLPGITSTLRVFWASGTDYVFVSESGRRTDESERLLLQSGSSTDAMPTATDLGRTTGGTPTQFVEHPDGLFFFYTQREVHGPALDYSRVAYVVSTDNGKTWSNPELLRLSIGGAGQQFTAAVVEPDGTVMVVLTDNSGLNPLITPEDTLVIRFKP